MARDRNGGPSVDSIRRIVLGVLIESIRQRGPIDESRAGRVADRITNSLAGESATVRAALGRPPTEAQRRTRENLAAAQAAVDRLRAIDLARDSCAPTQQRTTAHALGTEPRATVEPTGGLIWKWRVIRMRGAWHLYDGSTSLHLTRGGAERRAARWIRGGDR